MSELVEAVSKKLKFEPSLAYAEGPGDPRNLYVVVERSDDDKARYRTMGRMKDRLTKERRAQGANATGDLVFEWKPRFALIDQGSDLPIISVRRDGTLLADDALAQKFFGCSGRDLNRKVTGSV